MSDDGNRLKLPPFRDAGFYRKRRHSSYQEVGAPRLASSVADTHAHLHMLPDPAFELARCAVNGVRFLCMIVDPAEDGEGPIERLDGWVADARRELAGLGAVQGCKVPRVRIAVGVHPHNASAWDDRAQDALRRLAADPRVCAIGEIGLDYHYDLSPRETQRNAFRSQLRLAKELELPVALHVREAHDEAFAILSEEGFPSAGTLLHCCSLDADSLAPWVEAGCFIAYGGALTFKKLEAAREAAVRVPLNRLLTETDAPFMTPEPMRGVGCTPAHVVFTAAALAQMKAEHDGILPDDALAAFFDNALRLLDRPREAAAPGASPAAFGSASSASDAFQLSAETERN